MITREANLGAIETVARALGDISDTVAFVGGAVVALYADDPAAADPRPTMDIDIVVRIAGIS